jgi:phage terminase large subunit-like protein
LALSLSIGKIRMSEDAGISRNPGHRWQKGESGNREGRPKTSRRKLVDGFVSDLLESWKIFGKATIADLQAKFPDVYIRAVASLVQKEDRFRAKHSIDEDAVLAARLLEVKAELDAAAAAARQSSGGPQGRIESETNRLAAYRPYPKQAAFHAGGALYDERLLMAGNQLGKTLAGAMEWAMHLTGRYPDWWQGRVFDKPVRLWAAGVTAESTRDNPQRVLIGSPQQKEKWGTGTIPKDALKEWTPAPSVGGALDSVVVRWGGAGDVAAGESVLSFKAYEKGREKWQGETLDGVWFDEEPPLDIYSEGRTRCVARRGIVIVTLTPLQGMTDLVRLFLSEADLERLRKKP